MKEEFSNLRLYTTLIAPERRAAYLRTVSALDAATEDEDDKCKAAREALALLDRMAGESLMASQPAATSSSSSRRGSVIFAEKRDDENSRALLLQRQIQINHDNPTPSS